MLGGGYRPGHAVASRSHSSGTATHPGELVGLYDPAGQHRTTELEPLSHDLQAKFVKPTERAQVRAHEGSVRHVAPIGHPRHEQVPALLTESTGFGRHRQTSASSSARARPWS